MSKKKEISIRSGAAEYLTFVAATGEQANSIEMRYHGKAGKHVMCEKPMAKTYAETEFEKYRIIQDRLYESDFDRFLQLEKLK